VGVWKEALNWFFRKARAHRAPALHGVPTLGRVDLGQTDWEGRLIQRLRELHYAWRTEETYRGWAWRYHEFLGLRGRELGKAGAEDLRAFLSELAVKHRVSVATQKQALNALVFLVREVFQQEPGDFGDFERARRGRRLPSVLTRAECQKLFGALEGTTRLMAELMYGSGLRLTELLRLRIKDVDVDRRQVLVQAGKGDKGRATVLPESLVERVRAQRPGERSPSRWCVEPVEVAGAAGEALASVLLFHRPGRQVGVRLARRGASDPLWSRTFGHGSLIRVVRSCVRALDRVAPSYVSGLPCVWTS